MHTTWAWWIAPLDTLAAEVAYSLTALRCAPLHCSGPAALPTGQTSAARSSLTSLHMGKNIFQKKEIIKGVKYVILACHFCGPPCRHVLTTLALPLHHRSDLENAQLIFSTDMSELNINQVRVFYVQGYISLLPFGAIHGCSASW